MLTRCQACDEPIHPDDAIDGMCADCADIAPALPVVPMSTADQFRLLDAISVIYGTDVGDPDRDWRAEQDPDEQ